MTAAGELRVRPGDLEQAGRTAQKTAAEIPRSIKSVLSASDHAESGLHGWGTAGALNDCTNAWKALLDKLSAETDRAGANLIATAGNYRGADQQVQRTMANVSAWTSGTAPGDGSMAYYPAPEPDRNPTMINLTNPPRGL